MSEVINVCRYCKKMFSSTIKRTCCQECRSIDEKLFGQIRDYLKYYPDSSALMISRALGIAPKEILRFLDEGRAMYDFQPPDQEEEHCFRVDPDRMKKHR